MNGDPAYDQAGFNVTNVETLNEVTNTDKGLGNGSLFFNIDPSTSEPLKKGDRIVMESKSDSNFKFDTETNWLKVGKEITLSHGRSEGKGDSLINDHGVFITKLNYLKVKAVEVTPDKVVLEVMNDTYTENANIGAPIKITSFLLQLVQDKISNWIVDLTKKMEEDDLPPSLSMFSFNRTITEFYSTEKLIKMIKSDKLIQHLYIRNPSETEKERIASLIVSVLGNN